MPIIARDKLGRFAWQGGKQPVMCPACGRDFDLYPSDIKRGHRFCSYSCAMSVSHPHLARRRRVTKTCEVCENDFEVIAARAGARFCGNACKGIGMTVRPQIQAFYASMAWRNTRLQVWERDGYRCVECNKKGRLVAHHLDEIKKTSPDQWLSTDRIITLCIPDHNLVHGRFIGAT